MRGMRLARVDDGLELGVRKEAVTKNGCGQLGKVAGFGGATEAIAADCTSLVGCGAAPGMSIACRRKVS